MLRDHGRKDKYSSAMVGYNYRLGEIASAMGRVSLRHLTEWNVRRRAIARLYTDGLSNASNIVTPQEATWAHHVYHVYAIRSPNRETLREWLVNSGIETGLHYPIPCHAQPVYRNLEGDLTLPKTEKICSEVLSLPIHPEMSDADVEYVISSVRQFKVTR
jgi:dTDP-4-amino-4,6-dideoxygalactose transaminase